MSNILVTDDNSDYRASVIELLQSEGYTVLEAVNGADALALMRDQKPDLVLCDIEMPVMTGLEVLQIAKNDEELKKIPMIMVTANTEMETLNRIKALGADAYIYKPMQIAELLALLEDFLSVGK